MAVVIASDLGKDVAGTPLLRGISFKPPQAAIAEDRPVEERPATQRELERDIEAAEVRDLEDELADPAAWADTDRANASSERHATAKRRLEELYERWEAAAT